MSSRASSRMLAIVMFFAGCCFARAQAPMNKTPAQADPPAVPVKSLSVYPPQISLDGPRDEQRIGVVGEYADGRRWDLSRSATFSSSSEKVAVVDRGVVRPIGDGQAVVTITA